MIKDNGWDWWWKETVSNYQSLLMHCLLTDGVMAYKVTSKSKGVAGLVSCFHYSIFLFVFENFMGIFNHEELIKLESVFWFSSIWEKQRQLLKWFVLVNAISTSVHAGIVWTARASAVNRCIGTQLILLLCGLSHCSLELRTCRRSWHGTVVAGQSVLVVSHWSLCAAMLVWLLHLLVNII